MFPLSPHRSGLTQKDETLFQITAVSPFSIDYSCFHARSNLVFNYVFLLSGVAKSCSLPFGQAGTLNESIHFAKIRLYVLVV